MKLRYYADAPNSDDHERVLDLLHTIYDKYGTPIEIERVNKRWGWIQVFPGKVRDSSPEDVYDRDFHYNRTLGSNIGQSPSKAFKSSGQHIDLDGYVGIIDDGLVWATMYRGDAIGYGPDLDEDSTTLGFLDQVVKQGLDAIEEKYMGDEERERSVIDQFLATDVIDGTVRQDVTVGSSLVPQELSPGIQSAVEEIATRTIDAVIETEEADWVIHTAKMLDAPSLDTAVGHVIIRDQLYRQDNDLNIEETKRAVVFNTFPWELDIEVVPDVLKRLTTHPGSIGIEVFAGVECNFHQITD